ncbi:hypothetical protein F2Q69_00032338 [Brassica cretica]|uniref:Importin subunit alpha n=1 Tax=Brassica cretica TaxID=69181 RepID=A0A8S9RVQ6_BRACR|nr:hypothetical protein F2Q69_00032338 [Brassica cretica]
MCFNLPKFVVSAALPALAQLIRLDDKELLAYTCWALVYLSDGSNEKIQAVIEANVCGRLIGLSVHRSPSVATPALRTVGIVVTGNDSQTQYIIDLQALPCLLNLLRGPYNKTIRKEACWVISNITAGCQSQIQAVYDADICPALVNLLRNSEFDVKYEAAWAICNAVAGGSYKQILFLVKQDCIKALCDILTSSDTQLVMLCLESLEKILKVGEACDTRHAEGNQCTQTNVNPHAQLIEDAEGQEKIESLQSHENSDIYEMAVKILETYWLEEEEGEDEVEEEDKGRQDIVYFPVDNFANMPTPSCTLGLGKDVCYLFRGGHFGSEKTGGLAITLSSFVHTLTENQALPCLLNLLRGPYNKTIRKEACWVVSNITAGCQSQIQAVFDADICPALVNLLRNSEFDVKYEAAWAICNAIAGGSYKQILFLVKQDCIKPLCDILTSSDTQLVMLCLESLEKILKVGEARYTRHAEGVYQCTQTNVNPHAQIIEDAEGLEKIESLQSHENSDIYEMAVKILETYWLEEEEGEEEDKGRQDMVYFPVENFANMPTPSCTLGEMYCGP